MLCRKELGTDENRRVDGSVAPRPRAAHPQSNAGSRVAAGAFSTAVGTLGTNLTGLARQIVLAWVYGAGRTMDAFVIASMVAQSIFTAVDGAIAATLVPVYLRLQAESPEQADSFIAALASLLTTVTCLLGILLFFGAPIVVHLLAPGFSAPEVRMAAQILKVMLPSLLFMSLSSIGVGLLQATGRFQEAALMYAPRNIIVIIGCGLLGRRFGIQVLAIAWVLGSLAQLAVVAPPALRVRRVARLVWAPVHQGIRRMVPQLPAVCANFFMYQAALIVDRVLASRLPGGMISSLTYAQLVLAPAVALMGSVSVGLFPEVAAMVAKEAVGEVGRMVTTSLRVTAFVGAAISVFAILFRMAIVTVIYNHGAFSAHDLTRTAYPLALFAMGATSLVWNGVLGRTLFAVGDGRALLVAAGAGVVLTIVSDVALVGPMQQGGLALGTSVGSWCSTLVLLSRLGRSEVGLRMRAAARFLLSSAAAATVAYGAVALAVGRIVPLNASHNIGTQTIVGLCAIILGTALYVLLQSSYSEGRAQVRLISGLGRSLLFRGRVLG